MVGFGHKNSLKITLKLKTRKYYRCKDILKVLWLEEKTNEHSH